MAVTQQSSFQKKFGWIDKSHLGTALHGEPAQRCHGTALADENIASWNSTIDDGCVDDYAHKLVSKQDVEPILENAMREAMRKIVDAQPSKGKTIMSP